jgi:uncharacterized protein with ParB-like and HNH nuclease domain
MCSSYESILLKGKDVYKDDVLIGTLLPLEAIQIRDVSEIIDSNTKYFVPAYQRGYRWDEQQVKDLLNDIWEWGEGDKNKYCLQPIVIKSIEVKFDLVDGQLLLKNIFIILIAIEQDV